MDKKTEQPLGENTIRLENGKRVTFGGSLRMKDLSAWNKAETTGDLTTCYLYLSKLIVAWDWEELDPNDPTSIGELWLEEYAEINDGVGQYLARKRLGKS
ncbi:MAG: hypothetical protein KAY24_00130 [Candidatus Eisenbacteria sp.]|nr:hypothetical protein [Candidatus Eisenbacteria bacterium]